MPSVELPGSETRFDAPETTYANGVELYCKRPAAEGQGANRETAHPYTRACALVLFSPARFCPCRKRPAVLVGQTRMTIDAQKMGLRSVLIGRRKYTTGDWVREFIEAQAKAQAEQTQAEQHQTTEARGMSTARHVSAPTSHRLQHCMGHR